MTPVPFACIAPIGLERKSLTPERPDDRSPSERYSQPPRPVKKTCIQTEILPAGLIGRPYYRWENAEGNLTGLAELMGYRADPWLQQSISDGRKTAQP